MSACSRRCNTIPFCRASSVLMHPKKSFLSDCRLCREMQENSLEDNGLGLQSFRVHQLGNESRLIGSSAGSPPRKEEKWG